MKTIFFCLSVLFFLFTGAPTDSWKVVHNGKTRLRAVAENEEKNMVRIKKTDLAKSGFLSVAYTEAVKQKGWVRTFRLYSENDEEVEKYSGLLLKLPNARLRALAAKNKSIKLYTLSLPADPGKAAVVRVRRVHLCTIVFN